VTLLTQILERLRKEFDQAGKAEQFEALRGFLIGDHAGTTYSDVAVRLHITEAAARMAVSRMRRRYRRLLHNEIAQLVAEPGDIDDEIGKLFATLAQ
jgi:RNA polymerase sigma-70 factor (ECF subfamily)